MEAKEIINILELYEDIKDEIMTVDECAELMKVHRNTIINRIHAEKIKATFVCGVWRIPKRQFIHEIIGGPSISA